MVKKGFFNVLVYNATFKSFITQFSIFFLFCRFIMLLTQQLYIHTYKQLSDDIVDIAGTLKHIGISWILMDNGQGIRDINHNKMTRSYLNNLRIIIQKEKD